MGADLNRRFYESRSTAAHYARQSELLEDERAVLTRLEPEIRGGRILDLGVGGGRTTPFLLELNADYIGVDYSGVMVERCRQRFPGVKFEISDARDLSAYAEQTFDFVFFSNNGIDAVGHHDRIAVLRGVRRVLKDGALFVFSSHNRNFAIPSPWDLRHLAVDPLRHPIRFGKRAAAYPAGILNYLLLAHRAERHADHCLSVDSTHRYSLIHYRIAPAAQMRQLEQVGFTLIEAVGVDGRPLPRNQTEVINDPWVHYVCRRRSAR